MSADNNDDDGDMNIHLDAAEDEQSPPSPLFGKRRKGTACLARAALISAFEPPIEDRMTSDAVLAIVIEVPSPDWIEATQAVLKDKLSDRWKLFARDGSSRLNHRADMGNDEIVFHLSSGRCVAGIAATVAILPKALVAASDMRLRLKLDEKIVLRAIRDFTDTPTFEASLSGVVRLGFYEVASAFRFGSAPSEIADRVNALAAAKSVAAARRLPRLEDTVFGEARTWAMDLVRDYRLWQQKLLPWSAVSARCLFFGDPGVGKTFLAQVLANELGVPLTAASVSQLFAETTGYLHAVIQKSRDVWREAETSGGVLIWDEADSIPKREDLHDDRGNSGSYWMPVITDFLLMLDSAVSSSQEGLIVLMATNYVDRIDPALIRPGRMDRRIEIEPPDADGIEAILRFHLDGDLEGQDLAPIASTAVGRTPADLAQVVKTARRSARNEGRDFSTDDLALAVLPPTDLSADDLLQVCLHESGHAVAALCLDVGDLIGVTVGDVGGSHARTIMKKRPGPPTRDTIERRCVMRLAGRAAELERYGDAFAGSGGTATSDLALATSDLTTLTASCGLAGPLVYLGSQDDALDIVRRDPRIRGFVDDWLRQLQDRAILLVRRHAKAINAMSEALVRQRHLSGAEIRAFVERHPPLAETVDVANTGGWSPAP